MDDRIEHTSNSTVARSTLGRREMLQRTGFVAGAAAVAWATPTIHTVGSRAAAASDEFSSEACVDADGNKTGAPAALTFVLVPSPPNSDLNPPVPGGPWDEDAENITAWYDDDLNKVDSGTCDLSSATGPFLVEVGGQGGFNNFPTTLTSKGEIADGHSFTVYRSDLQSASNIFFQITPASGCVQRFAFHFSCSEPLIIGDRHGSVEITDFTES